MIKILFIFQHIMRYFLNTESSVFDRNRIYGGLGYKLSKNIKNWS